jgi:hypothetical protein
MRKLRRCSVVRSSRPLLRTRNRQIPSPYPVILKTYSGTFSRLMPPVARRAPEIGRHFMYRDTMQRDLSAPSGLATGTDAHAHAGAVPGVWPAIAMAALFALGSGGWLTSGTDNASASTGPNDMAASELAEVGSRDIAAALGTMDGDAAFLGQFKKRAQDCPQPLAWVSLARAPGQPPSQIRLQSGSYFSPAFNLFDAPMRVAIPFPPLYEMGHGNLVVFARGGSALVALSPVWKVAPHDGGIAHQVIWHPDKRCQ